MPLTIEHHTAAGRIRLRILPLTALIAAVALIAGCHGTDYTTGYGNVFVTYTNVGGDFPSYTATVSSITLTRTDGTVASAVSVAEVADFSKISDVAEMVSNTTIPIGTYTSATVTMDFTAAQAFVKVGSTPRAATIVDSTGAAPTTSVAVTVNFDPANPLVIPQSGAQLLNFEFDMSAANRIDYTTSTPTLTVTPFMTANNSTAGTRPIRVRGPLVSYNSQEATYTVYVRPFLDEVNNNGSLSLFGTSTTPYVIDNEAFVGAAGINAITNLGTGAITSAFTTYAPDSSAGTFTLTQSYVATAVESTVADRLEGTVIGRSGNTLTLRGSTLSLRTGGFTYYPTDATVTLAGATVVSIDGQPLATGITPQDISVGQYIYAFGQTTVTSGVVTMDATAGRVRLLPSRAWGQLTTGGVGTGTLNLAGFGDWPINSFSFAGTGTSSALDANPADYSLSAGSIDLTTLQGQPVAADGNAAPFGAAPPDFIATAVSSNKTLESRLTVDWGPNGTVVPFNAVSSASITPNLSDPNLGATHEIVTGINTLDIKSLTTSPTIVPATSGRPTFAVGNIVSGIFVFSKFSDFVAKLNSNATASLDAIRITATGQYDPATNTLTASRINVVLR